MIALSPKEFLPTAEEVQSASPLEDADDIHAQITMTRSMQPTFGYQQLGETNEPQPYTALKLDRPKDQE